jgi:4-amino-4-deoxy-L-arabinose transferase-like glycosyltransferase
MTEPGAAAKRHRWILAAIVALAFSIRLAAVLQYEQGHPNAAHPAIDEASYDDWARGIAAGDWIGKGAFFQEPLYPYALAALYAVAGPERLAARVAQCALWAATALLAGLLAQRLFGRAAAILAALAIALYGPGMLFPAFLLKENLLLPLFALLALALVRTRDEGRSNRAAWLAVGVLAGLGALLRGNLLAMIPLLVLWPVLRTKPSRSSLAAAALVLAGAALVLLPVAARNRVVGGEFLLTTSGAGTNLYGGNDLENPYGRATEFSFVRGIPEHEAGDWRREAERRIAAREGAPRSLSPGEVSAFWRGELGRSLLEHPREHLAILGRKLRLALGRYEVPDNHFLPWDERYVPLARAPWPAFGFLGTLGLAGVVLLLLHARWGKRAIVSPLPPELAPVDRGAAAEVALLGAAYVATVVLTVVSDRARLPIVPLLAPFAAWTLVWGARALRRRHPDALVQLAFAVAAAALPVYSRVLPDTEVAEDFAERDHNLAVQLLREGGRDREARAIAEELVREHPASARARILLAEIDLRAGKDPQGVLARVEPLADEPSLNPRERFRAASLVAWIQLRRGEFAQAERRFREALRFDGESRELQEGLVRALVGAVDRETPVEARRMSEEALAILDVLVGNAERGAEDPEIELLRAQAEFSRGRAMLDGPPGDDAERKVAQDAVQSALARLHRLTDAPATAPDLRRRSRVVAGGIQLYRRNFGPAENHFRAALAISDDPVADLGLLEALVGSLELGLRTEDRGEIELEAQRLLERCRQAAPPLRGIENLQERLAALR